MLIYIKVHECRSQQRELFYSAWEGNSHRWVRTSHEPRGRNVNVINYTDLLSRGVHAQKVPNREKIIFLFWFVFASAETKKWFGLWKLNKATFSYMNSHNHIKTWSHQLVSLQPLPHFKQQWSPLLTLRNNISVHLSASQNKAPFMQMYSEHKITKVFPRVLLWPLQETPWHRSAQQWRHRKNGEWLLSHVHPYYSYEGNKVPVDRYDLGEKRSCSMHWDRRQRRFKNQLTVLSFKTLRDDCHFFSLILLFNPGNLQAGGERSHRWRFITHFNAPLLQ